MPVVIEVDVIIYAKYTEDGKYPIMVSIM